MKLIEMRRIETSPSRYSIAVEVDAIEVTGMLEQCGLVGPRVALAPAPALSPAAVAPAQAAPKPAAAPAVKPGPKLAPVTNGALKTNGASPAPVAAPKARPKPVAAEPDPEPEEAADEEPAETQGLADGLPPEVVEAKRLIDVLNFFQDRGFVGKDPLVAVLEQNREQIALVGRIPEDLLGERVERALATFGR